MLLALLVIPAALAAAAAAPPVTLAPPDSKPVTVEQVQTRLAEHAGLVEKTSAGVLPCGPQLRIRHAGGGGHGESEHAAHAESDWGEAERHIA